MGSRAVRLHKQDVLWPPLRKVIEWVPDIDDIKERYEPTIEKWDLQIRSLRAWKSALDTISAAVVLLMLFSLPYWAKPSNSGGAAAPDIRLTAAYSQINIIVIVGSLFLVNLAVLWLIVKLTAPRRAAHEKWKLFERVFILEWLILIALYLVNHSQLTVFFSFFWLYPLLDMNLLMVALVFYVPLVFLMWYCVDRLGLLFASRWEARLSIPMFAYHCCRVLVALSLFKRPFELESWSRHDIASNIRRASTWLSKFPRGTKADTSTSHWLKATVGQVALRVNSLQQLILMPNEDSIERLTQTFRSLLACSLAGTYGRLAYVLTDMGKEPETEPKRKRLLTLAASVGEWILLTVLPLGIYLFLSLVFEVKVPSELKNLLILMYVLWVFVSFSVRFDPRHRETIDAIERLKSFLTPSR